MTDAPAAKGSRSSKPSTLAGTFPLRPNGIECFMRLGDMRQLANDNVASSVKEETTLGLQWILAEMGSLLTWQSSSE